MKYILSVFIAVSILLTGCVSSSLQAPLNRVMSQSARAQQLQCVTQWQLSGTATIQTPDQNVSVSVDWQLQDQNHYVLRAYGPLGSGSVQLTRTPSSVTLIEANGHQSTADNPELLMQQRLQWFLPLSNLYYWIRTLPLPNVSHIQFTDHFNHTTRLVQQDFTIDYLRFAGVQGVDLPSKLFIEGHGIKARILINQWHIEKNCV